MSCAKNSALMCGASALSAVVLTGVVAAGEPLQTPKLTEAAQSRWLSFGIVSGRVTLTGSRFGSINSTSSSSGRAERLTIRSTGSGPAVGYQMSGSAGDFSLELAAGNQLSIEWKPADEQVEPVRYTQGQAGSSRLEVGANQRQRIYAAPSVWHLMIAHPAVTRKHLVPLLELLSFELDPVDTADEVESALTSADASVVAPDRARWAALVEQLGAEEFARREKADRELREAGRMVVGYLKRLDPKQLDAEQQYRIHRIIQSMSSHTGNDTPAQITAWLAGDPPVWLSLLDRADQSVRCLAAERLKNLLGRPIDFDPAADAETRAAQLEHLRLQVPPE